jgi:hypothetical protein
MFPVASLACPFYHLGADDLRLVARARRSEFVAAAMPCTFPSCFGEAWAVLQLTLLSVVALLTLTFPCGEVALASVWSTTVASTKHGEL